MDPLTAFYLALLGMVASWIGAAISIYQARSQRKKTEADADASSADAVESYANATQTYAREVTALRLSEESLRMGMKALRLELDARDGIIREQRYQIDDLKDWADRLVYQLKSDGREPVPFRSSRPPRPAGGPAE